MENQALIRSSRQYPRGLFSKDDLNHCAGTWHIVGRPVKAEEWGHNLHPLRGLYRLIKAGHQGLREAGMPRKTLFNRGAEPPRRDFVLAQWSGQQRGGS